MDMDHSMVVLAVSKGHELEAYSDLDRLAKLRGGLRQQVLASPLFDATDFARHFESALWGMWCRWLERRHDS